MFDRLALLFEHLETSELNFELPARLVTLPFISSLSPWRVYNRSTPSFLIPFSHWVLIPALHSADAEKRKGGVLIPAIPSKGFGTRNTPCCQIFFDFDPPTRHLKLPVHFNASRTEISLASRRPRSLHNRRSEQRSPASSRCRCS